MKRGGKENRKDKTGIFSILSARLKQFTVEDGERKKEGFKESMGDDKGGKSVKGGRKLE